MGAAGRRGSYQASKQDLLARLGRIEGQVRGIAQMVDQERYCPQVLTQLSASISGLEKVGFILLRDHIEHCVRDDVRAGAGQQALDELIGVIHRFSGR